MREVFDRLVSASVPPDDVLTHPDYIQAATSDFDLLGQDDAAAADSFFGSLALPQGFLISGNPYRSIKAWTRLLDTLRLHDAAKYGRVHKGTPFYFLAVACYLTENFESALFYLDAAVSEDAARAPRAWHQTPAGLFLGLNAEPSHQFAQEVVRIARDELRTDAESVGREGGGILTPELLREKLVKQAVERDPALRSVAAALFTFLFEHRTRVWELEVSPRRGAGSGAACFLHLFKGALVFESLVRHSAVGIATGQTTLGGLLSSSAVKTALKLPTTFPGFGTVGLDVVASWGLSTEAMTYQFPQRAIRVTWGVRNTTGHALTWEELDLPTYRNLYLWVLGAVTEAVLRLY